MKNENVEVKIYVLYDPRECKVRYVGRTSKAVLKHRLIEHITKARYEHVYYPGKKSSHKNNWINSLLKDGVEPCIKQLTVVKGWAKSHILEKNLIENYSLKRKLVNYSDKGQGLIENYVSKEQREQISQTLKKFYTTNLNPRAKAIEVFDEEGNYINEYSSATEFAKIIGVTPRNVAKIAYGGYGRKSIKGYQVIYKGAARPGKIKYAKAKGYISNGKRKVITVVNTETNEVFEYRGIREFCQNAGFTVHQYYNRKKKSSTIQLGPYLISQGPV